MCRALSSLIGTHTVASSSDANNNTRATVNIISRNLVSIPHLDVLRLVSPVERGNSSDELEFPFTFLVLEIAVISPTNFPTQVA